MKRLPAFAVHGLAVMALLSLASCKTVTQLAVAGAAEAITGQDVDLDEMGDGGGYDAAVRGVRADRAQSSAPVASVYQAGPTPGWERGFRARVSVGSDYYQNSLCLNAPFQVDLTTLWSGEPSDPFGPIDRPGYEVFIQGNTHGIDPDYVGFGEVRLGGPSPTGEIWQSLDMAGMRGLNGNSCPFFGLFSFGKADGAALILK
ncbi:MAG: hypothetical protein R3304_10640 [Longimicrobiales bacterium]|nr:hypothetical protein [Longimicrobiales bacterium]